MKDKMSKTPTIVSVKVKELRKRGIKNFAEWNEKKNTLYIGRNMNFYVEGATKSKWHNPFPLKKYPDSLKRYKEYILKNEKLLKCMSELSGMELGCWCKPSKCHGDILISLFKELNSK
jgi:hypothetical protein